MVVFLRVVLGLTMLIYLGSISTASKKQDLGEILVRFAWLMVICTLFIATLF